MLFNSAPFLFVFLPVCIAGYRLLHLIAPARFPLLSTLWLAGASLWFYAQAEGADMVVLVASVAGNFAAANAIQRLDGRARRLALAAAVATDLGLLFFYKYAAFALGGWLDLPSAFDGRLPVGVSFFTFTQIAFLVDSFQGRAEAKDAPRYLLFVTFFPHLIAGPIIHHRETMRQFGWQPPEAFGRDLAVGLTIFAIGLFKKVVVADQFALPADAVFDLAAKGGASGWLRAWTGLGAYTLQIYFDFSGYSDMAIGLARLFGVAFPINFASPYKATSIADFWRRWHITLSRFLRDYLYFPLGGSRRGRLRTYGNLLGTMVLGGAWHGAGWTFIVWGAMHGLMLAGERALKAAFGARAALPAWAARPLVLLLVALAWVPFRASDMAAAVQMYRDLFGGFGLNRAMVDKTDLVAVAAGVVAVWALPATHEIMRGHGPGLASPGYPATVPGQAGAAWRPSLPAAAAVAAMLVFSLLRFNDLSSFIYFRF
ncbi:MAG: MBOAT family O-acyltransferase [Actinomycetota bacterium]